MKSSVRSVQWLTLKVGSSAFAGASGPRRQATPDSPIAAPAAAQIVVFRISFANLHRGHQFEVDLGVRDGGVQTVSRSHASEAIL
jgi:hypothetical protein